MRTYTDNLSWFVHGNDPLLDEEKLSHLAGLDILVIRERIIEIQAPGRQVSILTEDGELRCFDTLYPMVGSQPRIELLDGLGARKDELQQLWVDEHQRTSIPGIYAAGDVVHALNQMAVGAAHAAIAATAIHNALPKNYW